MRLHRLELTAFGPFAETAVVDFDELGADGLFLLHGQTGAGKTTVLDGIAFALYGSVPGARGEKRLRSDHADDQVSAQVALEATINGRRLRLTRSPEYLRPSKRDPNKLTKKQAAATLEWLDGRGQNLARISDVGDEVLRLMGMSAEQFFQVVLLPQGDFARFLRAKNEDRELLLEKLFETGRFGTAEQWLIDQRRQSATRVDAGEQNIQRIIDRVADAAASTGDNTVGILDSVDWSRRLLDAARIHATESTSNLTQRQADSSGARTAAESERQLHDRRRRLTAARTRLEALDATADHRAIRRRELDQARRAEPAAEAVADARSAAVALRHRTSAATKAATALAARLLQPPSAELAGTAWAAADLMRTELADTDLAADLDDLAASAAELQLAAVESEDRRLADTDGSRPPVVDELQPLLDLSDEEMSAGSRGGSADVRDPGGSSARRVGSRPGEVGTPAEVVAGQSDMRSALTSEPDAGIVAEQCDTRAADASPSSVTPPRRGVEAAVQRWSAQAGALEAVGGDVASARQLADDLKRWRVEHEELSKRSARIAGERAKLPETIAAVEVQVRAATDAAAGLPVLVAEHERLQAAATAAVELDRRRAELDRARTAFERARTAHTEAWQRTQALRAQRMAGMAGELAGALVDGEPCTVCGSLEHPDPARLAAHAVSKDDEDAALAAERAAEAARERAGQQVAELEQSVGVLVERGGDVDKAELAAALNDSTAKCAEARGLAGRADRLAAELTRLRADETRLQDELRDCETRAGTTAERLATADRRLAELSERLRTAAGADGTVDRRRARLDALVAEASALAEARSEVAAAREQVAAAAVRVEKLCYEAGLVESVPPVMGESGPDYGVLAEYAGAVDAASRTAAQQAGIEQELESAIKDRAAAESTLAEPDIQAAADIEPRDLDQLEIAVAQADSSLKQAIATEAESKRRVELLESLCAKLAVAVADIAPLWSSHEELSRLADVVAGRGENNRHMSLRSYVLAARLEEVALAASVRLRLMSGSRYEFIHTDAKGTHGRRGGLGLDIRDDYTGEIRPASSLSGGETFMASLSLALGLADVVSAEAGGRVMDTLFIDEGFGSLDADTLDAVMGVLDDLRDNGRVVGVVSHVDEMRQRIPSRLHVIRGRTGSRLETILSA